MTATSYEYPCGPTLQCGNKGPDGPCVAHLCRLCEAYLRTAVVGWNRRKAFDVASAAVQAEASGSDNAGRWGTAYAAVDALGDMAEDNHATYMFFRALHFVTCAQNGRTFGASVKHFNGLFDALPSLTSHTVFLDQEWERVRKCRQWCGRKAPDGRCKNPCQQAGFYLLDVRRIAGQPGLDRAREVIGAFAGMSGLVRCRAVTVAEDILGLDPISCAGLGQYTRKVVDGLEISLHARLDAWIADRQRWADQARKNYNAEPAERRQHGHAF